ncbi:MAG TPA: TolC family protein, partial [Polyangiaceae bacterium]|nr:TolC family protein [Polyangiaceae bacterium]
MKGRGRGGGRRLLGAFVLALGCGCDVGPRYVVPKAPVPVKFRESAATAYGGASPGMWQPARPEDGAIKDTWWQIFREPELDALEDRLDIDNQSIKQFFENFMAARAQVNQARAAYFPTISLSPSYSYSGTGGRGGTGGVVPAGSVAGGTVAGSTSAGALRSSGSTFNFYSIPLGASWAPDLWDRVRNTVRQARYQAQVSAADLENERLTEQATLAELYFELRGQDALQDLYERTIEADRKSLELTRAQFTTGVGTAEAVAQAEVVVANVEAAAVGIATNRALFEHAIATLVGKPASDFTVPVKALATPVP